LEPGRSPSRGAVAWVTATLALLAAPVWALNPGQPRLAPARLGTPPEACARLARDFTPTDITDLREAPFPTLPQAQKYRALFRMNTEACACGCKLSIVSCRVNNPTCRTSADLAKKIVAATAQGQ